MTGEFPTQMANDAEMFPSDDVIVLTKNSWILQVLYAIGIGRWSVPMGLFHLQYFARNSNSMEISRCCDSVTDHLIETQFGTCHDSIAAV